MTYAAELIDATMKATGLSQAALAKRLAIAAPQLSKWRHGTKPIPEEQLSALLDLGNFNEATREYFSLGVMRDTVTTTGVMRALDAVLERLRPAAAVVGPLVLCAIVVGNNLTYQALGALPPMSIMSNWLAKAARWLATAKGRLVTPVTNCRREMVMA